MNETPGSNSGLEAQQLADPKVAYFHSDAAEELRDMLLMMIRNPNTVTQITLEGERLHERLPHQKTPFFNDNPGMTVLRLNEGTKDSMLGTYTRRHNGTEVISLETHQHTISMSFSRHPQIKDELINPTLYLKRRSVLRRIVGMDEEKIDIIGLEGNTITKGKNLGKIKSTWKKEVGEVKGLLAPQLRR